MSKPVDFKFDIHEIVWIIPLELKGEILARCDRGTYLEYRIVYWAESKRNDEWLHEQELRSL